MVGRALFIWLLVLAVPVQGLAAALMVSCGGHQRVGASSVLLPLQADHGAMPENRLAGVHAADAAGAPCPHAAQTAGAGAGAGADLATGMADPATPAQGGSHTCSACAACCSVGAPQSLELTVPAADSPVMVFAAVETTVDGFAADGLERPPRTVAA